LSIILNVGRMFLFTILALTAIAYIAVPATIGPIYMIANQTAGVFGVDMRDFEAYTIDEGMGNFALVGVVTPIAAMIMIVEYLHIENEKKKEVLIGARADNPFSPVTVPPD